MTFKEYLQNNIVYLDGGMGTLLQRRGLKAGEAPEEWNVSHPEVIREIHKEYFEAGSNVVCTNTFGANTLKFSREKLEEIVRCAIENASWARDNSFSTQEKFIALDLGPTGKLLKPLGDLEFEKAVSIFAETVKLGAKYGADLVIIETMSDSYETKAALLAVKENCSLPVMVSNAYSEDGKLLTGATPEAMVALLEGMGADVIGANCSLGPEKLAPVAKRLLESASVPVLLKPNAGLPRVENGQTVFDVSAEEFANQLYEIVENGVCVVGGCCGTTPEYISALVKKTSSCTRKPVTKKDFTVVSSYSHAVTFGDEPILVGERINPTGKKRFKQALKEKDMDYILSQGVQQQEKGAHILDVNVGAPEIDERELLPEAVCELQAVLDLPLQIDSSDVVAMEKALRVYNGKAMINSVNGKKESMEAVFPLVKKYGGVVVALTLDEKGIPETAQERFEIAKKILTCAEEYGIDKKDVVFDTLTLTVSADSSAAKVTLDALKMIREKLSCHTILGVSNVSFGLPNREIVNGTFFTLALASGLSCAIMNPCSSEMMKAYYTFRALTGLDESCMDYISASKSFEACSSVESVKAEETEEASSLKRAIIKGLKDRAREITEKMLSERDGLDIVNQEIIPALNVVGEGFENKTVFLPQLLLSAEAAGYAFEEIKARIKTDKKENKGTVILATVKGDIHDIGKNIVKLLLENYGFNVLDLGKDVNEDEIVKKVKETDCRLVGLSALMTTTVVNMEQTVLRLNKEAPNCKIMVGGAVLTEEYAKKIGADAYAKDAMAGVRYAQEILG
ncbi:MAG: homocysteine S-methyltransferase family protein [Clostridia bacterium]|nr:homocysteine S-methyltransferase family protein [Clostridia bacterium]